MAPDYDTPLDESIVLLLEPEATSCRSQPFKFGDGLLLRMMFRVMTGAEGVTKSVGTTIPKPPKVSPLRSMTLSRISGEPAATSTHAPAELAVRSPFRIVKPSRTVGWRIVGIVTAEPLC